MLSLKRVQTISLRIEGMMNEDRRSTIITESSSTIIHHSSTSHFGKCNFLK